MSRGAAHLVSTPIVSMRAKVRVLGVRFVDMREVEGEDDEKVGESDGQAGKERGLAGGPREEGEKVEGEEVERATQRQLVSH